MNRVFMSCCIAIFGLWVNAATANTFATTTQYSDERELFQQAKRALASGNRAKFKVSKRELIDYPLYPYLEYAELASTLRLSSEQRVQSFLKEYAGTPVARRLQHKWLEYLRRRNSGKTFIKHYADGNTKQQCYYAQALYRSGDKQQGLSAALPLWNVAKSQPKACDKIFHLLIASGTVTEAIAWERYQKAVAANQKKLIRYLKRFFTSSYYKKAYANYEAMRRSPSQIRRYAEFNDRSEANKAVLSRTLRRLASSKPNEAQKQWRYFQTKFEFNPKQQQGIQTALIKSFITSGQIQQGDALLETNKHSVSADLIEWRLRQALAMQDWTNVRYWAKQLPPELADEQRWRYWLARAETQMTPSAQLKDHPFFASLANERGYYSFLAADELQQAYSMDYQPSAISADIVSKIETNPFVIRSRELFLVGENINAVREWSAAGKSFSDAEWEAAGLAFYEWGWHYIAIISMVKARAWQDIVVRFPVLHENYYRKHASKHHLDAQLLMAITRQESAFNTTAVSPSNAKGLMQLLPSTAQYIAKRASIPYRSSADLLNADKNIALGSAYYKYLMNKFDDHRAVSIASYNAGPNRVSKWLNKSAGNLPIDIWVETIPYSETRRYVQNVLTFSVIYAQHLGESAQLFTYNEKTKPL